MGRLSRLVAVEEQLRALLPLPPVSNPTYAELVGWAADVRFHMARGYFANATPEEWIEVLEYLQWIDSLDSSGCS